LGLDPKFASPDDVGIVAKAYPDVNFLIYHSGFDTTMTEGPYNPMNPVGTDRLIKSLQDNGVAPNSNVYAELGSTWKYTMPTPDAAAHVLGKLLKYVGEDRVVWGTDSLFYGGPQDQIVGFRAFQISQQFQDMYGYPALTQAIKDKIFGLNAASVYGVDVTKMRCKIKDETDFSKIGLNLDVPKNPPFKKYGPQTRREMFAFLRAHGGFAG
jgi:predicted TIM-barrel fold metal-dependent hydrolase